MTNYAQHLSVTNTPQTEQADPAQVPNSAGGYSFAVDKWKRLERFLILGAEGGSYYATERKLTIENAKSVNECLSENPVRTIDTITQISVAGRAAKNDPAIFALALASAHTSPAARELALAALPKVARIGTHLFQFVEAVDSLRGWGRGLRRAVGAWYESKTTDQVAYQALKYQQRNGWSHRDVLRLAHLTPSSSDSMSRLGLRAELLKREPAGTPVEHVMAKLEKMPRDNQAVYRWITHQGETGPRNVVRKNRDGVTVEYPAVGELPALLAAYEQLKTETELPKVLELIRAHKLTHEMIPGDWKSKPEVWEALSEHMPMHALVRNLANLTAKGIIAPLSDGTQRVVKQLGDADAIKKSRLHPIAILSALRIYEKGRGDKGKLTWTADQQVLHALAEAFYKAFDNVESSGKRLLLALDVSGSMGSGEVAGVPGLTPREASAAMALVTMRTEIHHVIGFTGGGGGFYGHGTRDAVTALNIRPEMSLGEVTKAISGLPMGPTDIAQPMLYAMKHKLPCDAVIVMTDSETYMGTPHPHTAMAQFRKQVEKPVGLITVAMVSNGFSVADPKDPHMLDCVGFDTSTPAVMADFIRGLA